MTRENISDAISSNIPVCTVKLSSRLSLHPTDCPWVSEDDEEEDIKKELSRLLQDRIFAAGYPSSFPTPHDTA